jgi:hypothetical protein
VTRPWCARAIPNLLLREALLLLRKALLWEALLLLR